MHPVWTPRSTGWTSLVITLGLAAAIAFAAIFTPGASGGQPGCGTYSGRGCAPASKRIDLRRPSFSRPTEITNPLFPISRLRSALLLGHVGGKPFRTETTLLPGRQTIHWDGRRVQVRVSQYVAYLGGRIEEVALDRYAQADDGSVWYFGEDVFDYENGTVATTEGTWLAGREGPPAMIMPASPRVGDVFRTENAPPIVFEEVKVKSVARTVSGPRGPVHGAILAEELHSDGTHEDKIFAPGYGEFRTAGGGDLEALALAAPTDAVHAPLPGQLRSLATETVGIFDAVEVGDWRAAGSSTAHAQVDWKALRGGEPRMVADRLGNALAALTGAVERRRSLHARQAAIDVLQSTLDLRLQYRAPAAIDRERFVLWTRQLLLDAGAHNRGGVEGDVATLEWIRDRISSALDPIGRREIDTRLRDLRNAADAGNLPAAADHAARLASRLRILTGSLRAVSVWLRLGENVVVSRKRGPCSSDRAANRVSVAPNRCDLHVHSRFSTDSGNYALRRARLGESYTEPGRVYQVCRRRGMRFVTISDHNTVDGALEIADLPDTFLSVEVTTRFPEDDVPLHVLVWNLTEEDHRELQPLRPSVYELQRFLTARELPHALAHPLYRMGPPITPWHVERMMLLFGVWEGRNGGRPSEHNDAACRLAALVTAALLERLADRHDLEPKHTSRIALTGGSDDHGALDIATTWTAARGETVKSFLADVMAGGSAPAGGHGSAEKLAHAVLSLFLNAYRTDGAELPAVVAPLVEELFDTDAEDASERHEEITTAAVRLASTLGARARAGGLGFDAFPELGQRLARIALAGALQAPFLATARHHADARRDLAAIESAFFGARSAPASPRAFVFTDTFEETNGVAGTMRRLAAAAADDITVVTSGDRAGECRGLVTVDAEWSFPLPTSEHIDLRFPSLIDVLRRVESARPDVIQVATPGPVGACGLAVAKLLGIPVLGSYHTELGPYALHLTRDLLVAEAMSSYVDWFYGRCDAVLAPTFAVAHELARRGVTPRVRVWSRGVDTGMFTPARRDEAVRTRLLEDGSVLALSVGRVSVEKRLDVLLQSLELAAIDVPGIRLVIVGDGPARAALEAAASERVTFIGELHGDELATAYASADIFCFPSTTDTFGQVLLEAGASGLPVVAAAAGGAVELVVAGVSGELVPADDAEAFARALRGLATSAERRALLARGGRDAALRRTWERSFDELRAAYRSAILSDPQFTRQPLAA